jgi:3-dehydroquinate dehydratase I
MKKASILHNVSVVAAVADPGSLANLPQLPLAEMCDVVELRLDAWPQQHWLSVRTAGQVKIPLLMTARSPNEGGRNNLSAIQRELLLKGHLPYASLVDIEIASIPDMGDTLEACREGEIPVIGSFHDFEEVPDLEILQEMAHMAKSAGLQAVKFALTVQKTTDLARLIELLEFSRTEVGLPTSVMGMGALGKVSRLMLAKCGSCLNYGFLDEATVPGQWAAAELKKFITLL